MKSQVICAFGEAMEHLQSHRGVFVGEGFHALSAFIGGYCFAIARAQQVDLYHLLHKHVQTIYQKDFALIWDRYLLHEVAKGDERLATELLFETIKSFVSAHSKS